MGGQHPTFVAVAAIRRDALRRQDGALRRQHGASREADASKEVVAESRVRRGGLRGLGLGLGFGLGLWLGLG